MRVLIASLAGVMLAGAAGAQPDCTAYIPPATLMWGGPLYSQDTAGWSIAAEGDRVAVGDPFYASSATSPQGWVYIYRKTSSGSWLREAALWADTQAGYNLRMKNSLLVGRAPSGLASLFVYEHNPAAQGTASWTRLGLLTPQFTTSYWQLYDSGMDYDGTTLAVTNRVPTHRGYVSRVELYTRDISAPMRFVPSGSVLNPEGAVSDSFGSRLAVDGDILAVGSPNYDFAPVPPRVDVYQNMGGVWTFAQRIADPAGFRYGVTFGIDIVVKGDTLALSVGHDPDTPNVAGQPQAEVRVYRRVPMAGEPDQWVLEQTLMLADGTTTDGFGGALAMKQDWLLVGAPNQNYTGPMSGALHLFSRAGTVWTHRAVLSRANSAGARIGWSVAMTPDLIVSGALGFQGRGAGFVFDVCAQLPPSDATPECLPGILGLYTFINAWMSGSMFADFDRSGALEVVDIFLYLDAWLAGCP